MPRLGALSGPSNIGPEYFRVLSEAVDFMFNRLEKWRRWVTRKRLEIDEIEEGRNDGQEWILGVQASIFLF